MSGTFNQRVELTEQLAIRTRFARAAVRSVQHRFGVDVPTVTLEPPKTVRLPTLRGRVAHTICAGTVVIDDVTFPVEVERRGHLLDVAAQLAATGNCGEVTVRLFRRRFLGGLIDDRATLAAELARAKRRRSTR